MSYKKESMLARMRRWSTHRDISKRMNISARRVWGKPYRSHMTPNYKDYWIEIGDSVYGKKGTWKAELDLGCFEEGFMSRMEAELRLSNPEVFLWDEVKIRKIGYA
mgnify:FL=1|jgi:hypothetical protein